MRASDPKNPARYLQTNALRTLGTVPSKTVVRLAKALSASTESADRRATVATLEKVDGTGRLDVLRSLTKDTDVDVAESALRTLNEALRSTLPIIAADTVWDVRLAKAGVHVLYVLDDHTAVLGIGYGAVDESRVAGVDLVTHKLTWTYPTADGVRSNAVRIGDRLYFVSDDRVLHCISVSGNPVWAKPLSSNPDLVTTGPAIVAAFGRLFVPDGNSLYVATPDGQIETHKMGEHVSRSLVQGRRRVFSAIHNGPLVVFDDPAQPPTRVSAGLKTAALLASGDAVCILSFGPAQELQCLDQETLHELWRTDLPNETGGFGRLEQDGKNVYVLAQGGALAFDIASGKRLWATDEFTSGAFFNSFGRAALTRNFHFELEWRDTASGEIIGIWGTREHRFAGNAVFIGEAILVETRGRDQEDGLRLMRVPETIARRLTAR
jgi:outer membrane protein assembly factor BamB